MSVRQIEFEDGMGDFRPQAVIDQSPSALSAKFGIKFEMDCDSLDDYQAAAMILEDGDKPVRFVLKRHVHSPSSSTTILLGTNYGNDAVKDITYRILLSMEMTKNVLWPKPSHEAPQP